MLDDNRILTMLPPMLSGEQLQEALRVLPAYDSGIRKADAATRLLGLSDLYRIYLPSQMSLEIYSKLYLAVIRSLQKKGTRLSIRQSNENARGAHGQEYGGIIGGADSFTIIGVSGIGKSSAISRSISLITRERVIELEQPYGKLLPCVVVQCPFDCSVKGMLLEILRKVDEALGSAYFTRAVRAKATTDMLIGSVSQVALNHIGLLVVDEIQNVVNSKNGKSLVGSLTQLINNSGISICMVGTPESTVFFESAMHLARRSLGLTYQAMPFDAYFHSFCETLFSYQYVEHASELTPAIVEWLYEHSAGVLSVVVSLIHDAQEISILNGREMLDMAALREAYQERMTMLQDYLRPDSVQPTGKKQTDKTASERQAPLPDVATEAPTPDIHVLTEAARQAREEQTDVVELLRSSVTVEEVAV